MADCVHEMARLLQSVLKTIKETNMAQSNLLRRWMQLRNPAEEVQPLRLLENYEMGTRLIRTRLILQGRSAQTNLALIRHMMGPEFPYDMDGKTEGQPTQVTPLFLHKVFLAGGVSVVTFLMVIAAIFVIRLGRAFL